MKKKKFQLVIVLTLGMLIPMAALQSEPPQEAGSATLADDCQSMHDRAIENLNDLFSKPRAAQGESRSDRYEQLLDAARVCRKAAEMAADREHAASLMALSYLSLAREQAGNHGDPQRRREILAEGVHEVSGMHYESSPALFELLRKSAYEEAEVDHSQAVQLMERAVAIARAQFGEEDPRTAIALFDLGFLYAPSTNPGSGKRASDDPEKAESFFRGALKLFEQQAYPAKHSEYGTAVSALRDLLLASGRHEEARGLKERLDSIALEEDRWTRSQAEEPSEIPPSGRNPS